MLSLLLLFYATISMAQIQEANELLGKKYNFVYDKGKYLQEYKHKIETYDGVVARVTIICEYPKEKAIDLVAYLLGFYWNSADSILYETPITSQFTYDDLIYDEDSISYMQVYMGQYHYTFTHHKTTYETQVIHQLIQKPRINFINKILSQFKVTKYVIEDKKHDLKQDLSDSDMVLRFYKDSIGNDIFASFWSENKYCAVGKVENIESDTVIVQANNEKVQSFMWEYFDTYSGFIRRADVAFTTLQLPEQTNFKCQIYIRNDDIYVHIEGYQQK
jgi:hypothetical protein